ncbi:hypothetical protein BKK79_12990 [Cupriavidus sp. USMAA2-4]|uniref:GlsB/YeaQ/YmgE family stress response membrane protein n=1 Tax=Cupriavidus malaysiensis TaxID=367825 RepID=A0ABN4TQW4_9BURK|nr:MULTISPECIES: hypothetical protein [Cupriavidus]AOY92591.1 hypothetical protein BKK79_12990 [Cupriavidus sp. USMAA2-4]AOZ00964.1 hypothetical protein BKK81_18200 [Cupriavidus sp. USMAHM13]AOZ07695.1 hypothetical protein BKK80_19055 [Cupriavidus malaysiensis]
MVGILVVGALVGLTGRQLHPVGRRVVGWRVAPLLGAVGAALAFYGGQALRWFIDGQMIGWGAAILGAALLTALWGLVFRRG